MAETVQNRKAASSHMRPDGGKPRRVRKVVLVVLAVLVGAFGIASVAIDYSLLQSTLARADRGRTAIASYEFYARDYTREPVEFTSGGTRLQGYYYGLDLLGGAGDAAQVPLRRAKGVVVFCHGIGSWHQDYLALLTSIVDDGWVVFAYDATGSGESDGGSSGSLAQSALDADAALSLVEADARLDGLPVVVIGHSWGGYAAAAVLNFDHDVAACVSLSGYSDPMAIIMEWARRMLGPVAEVERPFIWIANHMIAGMYADLSAVDGINGADVPVLVVHADADQVIAVDGAAIYGHRGQITNPQVQYRLFTDEGRNGHNTYFNSIETQEYLDEKAEELRDLQRQAVANTLAGSRRASDAEADGDVPEGMTLGDEYDEVEEEFFAQIDIARANEPNPDLVELVCGFIGTVAA